MSEAHDDATRSTPQPHACGGLFGCGEENGTGIFREDIKDAAFDNRAADRLLHMDEVDQERLDTYLSTRGRLRRKFLGASSFMGLLAAVEPWFGKLAHAADAPASAATGSTRADQGRVHEIQSTKETVHLGVFDATLPPLVTVVARRPV